MMVGQGVGQSLGKTEGKKARLIKWYPTQLPRGRGEGTMQPQKRRAIIEMTIQHVGSEMGTNGWKGEGCFVNRSRGRSC